MGNPYEPPTVDPVSTDEPIANITRTQTAQGIAVLNAFATLCLVAGPAAIKGPLGIGLYFFDIRFPHLVPQNATDWAVSIFSLIITPAAWRVPMREADAFRTCDVDIERRLCKAMYLISPFPCILSLATDPPPIFNHSRLLTFAAAVTLMLFWASLAYLRLHKLTAVVESGR